MRSSKLKKAVEAWGFMQSTGAYRGLVRLQEYAAQELQRIQEGYASTIAQARLEDSRCYTAPDWLDVTAKNLEDLPDGEMRRVFNSFDLIYVSIPLSELDDKLPSVDTALVIADLHGLIFGHGRDKLGGKGYALQLAGRVYLLNQPSLDNAKAEAFEIAQGRLGCVFVQIKSTSCGKVIYPKGWEP